MAIHQLTAAMLHALATFVIAFDMRPGPLFMLDWIGSLLIGVGHSSVAEALLLELATLTFALCRSHVCLSLPQVVLCVGSMFWTQEVAESIRSNSLPAYSKKCTEDLLDVSYTPPSHALHMCALLFSHCSTHITAFLPSFQIAVTTALKTIAVT